MRNFKTVIATWFNKDRDVYNLKYTKMFNHLHCIKAILTGTHATVATHIKEGILNAIPRINHLAIGMMANLTMNLISGEGLTNSARAIVRDIVY